MTCKDCIYYEHCHSEIAYGMGSDDLTGEYFTDIETRCKSFKNKADYAEVKHGKWETGHFEGGIFDGTNFEKCNVCQFERLFEDVRFKTTFNYCPNCGAKMDKKEGAE